MPTINILNQSRQRIPSHHTLRRLLAHLCETLAVADKELELVFVSDEQMRPYYRDYFGEDRATDVIAFPLESLQVGKVPQGPHLGSIVIAMDTAKRQAKAHRQSLWHEIRFLLIHGLLHLLGHDHAEPEETRVMKQKEQELLALTSESVLNAVAQNPAKNHGLRLGK